MDDDLTQEERKTCDKSDLQFRAFYWVSSISLYLWATRAKEIEEVRDKKERILKGGKRTKRREKDMKDIQMEGSGREGHQPFCVVAHRLQRRTQLRRRTFQRHQDPFWLWVNSINRGLWILKRQLKLWRMFFHEFMFIYIHTKIATRAESKKIHKSNQRQTGRGSTERNMPCFH